MDTQAVFVTTCLIAGIGSILMGLLANLPIALAPEMGLNAFFAFVLVAGMGYSPSKWVWAPSSGAPWVCRASPCMLGLLGFSCIFSAHGIHSAVLIDIVVCILFLLAIFFSPVADMVPAYGAAGALIHVGVLMCSELTRIKWEDLTESVPTFMTAVMIPFSLSIT